MTARPPTDWAAYADCPECGAPTGRPCRTEGTWYGSQPLNSPHPTRDTKAQPSLFATAEETP